MDLLLVGYLYQYLHLYGSYIPTIRTLRWIHFLATPLWLAPFYIALQGDGTSLDGLPGRDAAYIWVFLSMAVSMNWGSFKGSYRAP